MYKKCSIFLFLLISIMVIALDQWSKYWIVQHLMPYEPQYLNSFCDLLLAYNSGSAFSFLAHTGSWHGIFFITIGFGLSAVLLVWMVRLSHTAWGERLALSFILGGAIANIIDRLRLGRVVDFIDVHYKTHHWPVFNLADSAICLGCFLLLLGSVSAIRGKNPQ